MKYRVHYTEFHVRKHGDIVSFDSITKISEHCILAASVSKLRLTVFPSRPSPASSSLTLEQLRQERLCRERAERARTEALLAQRAGTLLHEEEEADERKRGYNSQFHPQLARKRVWDTQK